MVFFVVVVFLWCSCGVFVVVFLLWCFCGGVVCSGDVCAGVFVVFLWWCFCGVFLVVWWCFCFFLGQGSTLSHYREVMQRLLTTLVQKDV